MRGVFATNVRGGGKYGDFKTFFVGFFQCLLEVGGYALPALPWWSIRQREIVRVWQDGKASPRF